MNLPNGLTLFRFILIPVYLLIFLEGHMGAALAVLIVAGLTDVLDGYLARRRKQITALGSMLDPLADKTMMLVIILSFLYTDRVSWLAAIALFIRDGGMIIGSAIFHYRGKKVVPANVLGKLSAILYYLAVPLLMFKASFAMPYLWVVIVFFYVTSYIYIRRIKQLNR